MSDQLKVHTEATILTIFLVDRPDQSDAQTRQDVRFAVQEFLNGPEFANALTKHVASIGLNVTGAKINT